jgi:hypothetical protein
MGKPKAGESANLKTRRKVEVKAGATTTIPADQPYRSQIEIWLKNYLSMQFGVRPDDVLLRHSLRGWGYGDETRLAKFVKSYNLSIASRPLVSRAPIVPPDLIENDRIKTVGDLLDFLSAAHQAAAITAPQASPGAQLDAAIEEQTAELIERTSLRKAVRDWMLEYIRVNVPRAYSTLKAYGDLMLISSIFSDQETKGGLIEWAQSLNVAVNGQTFGPVRDSNSFKAPDDLYSFAKKRNFGELISAFETSVRNALHV